MTSVTPDSRKVGTGMAAFPSPFLTPRPEKRRGTLDWNLNHKDKDKEVNVQVVLKCRFDIFKYLSELLHGSQFCWDWKGSERYKSKYTFMVLLHAQQEPSNKEKVAQEVRDVVGINHEANNDEFVADITDAALEQMHHLHSTLTETLRLYPAVPL